MRALRRVVSVFCLVMGTIERADAQPASEGQPHFFAVDLLVGMAEYSTVTEEGADSDDGQSSPTFGKGFDVGAAARRTGHLLKQRPG